MERGSQMNPFINRMLKLLTVKSIVTLILTLVFACLALQGSIDQDFMTIYAVIIAFYFGTQTAKAESSKDGE